MLLFYLRKIKRKKDDIKIQLVYKSSPGANFRLLKALNMLLSEEDIRNYFEKNKILQQNRTIKPERHTKDNINLHYLVLSIK